MIPAPEPLRLSPRQGVTVLRVVCSWCKAVLREGDPGAATTHGMCEGCAATFRAQLDQRVVCSGRVR